MAFANALKILPEPVRTLAFGSIGAAYMGIGTALENPARVVFLQNLTDATLMFSFDGVDDHFPLPSFGFLLLDIASNKTGASQAFYVSEGTRFYVKELGTPTSGSVYVTPFYGYEGT